MGSEGLQRIGRLGVVIFKKEIADTVVESIIQASTVQERYLRQPTTLTMINPPHHQWDIPVSVLLGIVVTFHPGMCLVHTRPQILAAAARLHNARTGWPVWCDFG